MSVHEKPRQIVRNEGTAKVVGKTSTTEDSALQTFGPSGKSNSAAAKGEAKQDSLDVPNVTEKQVAPSRPMEFVDHRKVALDPEARDALLNKARAAIEHLVETKPFGRVKILLQPEELGAITVTVRTMAGKVDAEVTASNESVRAALEAARPALAPAVESKGLQLTSLTIQGQGLADRQDSAFRQSQTPTHQEFQRMVGERLTREGVSQPEERRHHPLWSDQIDLRI
jgi:flagellar hook-length control protein FliK